VTAYDDIDTKTRVTLYRSLTETCGSSTWYTWAGLVECVEDPFGWPDGGKTALPLWAWHEIEGDDRRRRPAGLDSEGGEQDREPDVYRIHALVLDYDSDPEFGIEAVRRWWGALTYVAHTTAGHSDATPKGRVVLALSRPVTPAEYAAIVEWVLVSGRGQMGEPEIRSPARAYFVPASAPGGYWFDPNLASQALDVDVLLERLTAAEVDASGQAGAPDDAINRTLIRRGYPPAADADEDDWAQWLARDPRALLVNLAAIFGDDPRWDGRLHYCEFRRRVLIDSEPLTDADAIAATLWAARTYSIHAPWTKVSDVLVQVAHGHPQHPVRTYFDGLAWDREPRLDQWLRDYLGCVGDDLSTAMGSGWMISAVARIYEPGCQVDTVLTLRGEQGVGKSSALRVLAGEWFADTLIDFRSSDACRSLAGVLIYELAELDSLARQDASAAKAFLSGRIDHYRAPYGRHFVDVPRQCVFAATTNEGTFLRDPTGSRRFWVREVGFDGSVDLVGLERDRDQLWAEAVARYRAGESWHLSPELERARAETAGVYRQRDPWEILIADWLVTQSRQVEDREILEKAIGKDRAHRTRTDGIRVSTCMQALGWTRERRRIGGTRRWIWVR